jgi:hypothetical protein
MAQKELEPRWMSKVRMWWFDVRSKRLVILKWVDEMQQYAITLHLLLHFDLGYMQSHRGLATPPRMLTPSGSVSEHDVPILSYQGSWTMIMSALKFVLRSEWDATLWQHIFTKRMFTHVIRKDGEGWLLGWLCCGWVSCMPLGQGKRGLLLSGHSLCR